MGLTVKNVIEWMNNFSAKIEQNKQFLSDLDTAIGDGDHGFNMSRGMTAVSQKLSTDPKTITDAFALTGIKKRGGAEPGDKTMVDVWTALVPEVKTNKLTQEKIASAVEATKDLVAKKGRASYLGERSKGHVDPGSQSSGYLFEALLETEGIL